MNDPQNWQAAAAVATALVGILVLVGALVWRAQAALASAVRIATAESASAVAAHREESQAGRERLYRRIDESDLRTTEMFRRVEDRFVLTSTCEARMGSLSQTNEEHAREINALSERMDAACHIRNTRN
jgi:hypothetical protein